MSRISSLRPPPTAPGRDCVPGWVAVLALFAFDGFVFGTWAACVPDISLRLGLSAAALGDVLLCVSVGALATMQLAGRWCARYGAGAVGVAAGLLLSLALVLPVLADTTLELAGALGVFGAATGAVLGGAAAVTLGVLPHLALVGAIGALLTCAVARSLAQVDPLPAESARPRAGRTGTATAALPLRRPVPHRMIVVLLGAIAACTAFAEGTLTDWAALHLRTDLGAGPVVAAAGFAGFSLAMGLGRLGGGWALQRFGAGRLLTRGALSPSAPIALIGFLLVGVGLANVFPVALAAGGALAGPQGVALAATVGYSGLLGGPPLIGLVAEHLGLPIALTAVAGFTASVAVLALVVRTLAARSGVPVLIDGRVGRPRSPLARETWRRAVSGGIAGYVTDLEFLQQPRL